MPRRESPHQKRRRLAAKHGITDNTNDFAYMCKKHPARVGIICEGDSWFAYPRKWLAFGADINVIHHIAEKIENTDSTNMLRLASNGDEAIAMTTGKQFNTLSKIIERNSHAINLLLFSGGGNDIVGKNDMLPLLNKYTPGMTYLDCVHQKRFERKIEAILLAYSRLVDLCEDVAPQVKIISHTYDIAKPWNQGAEFFWGLIKTAPWVYPYMVERGIPYSLHLPVIEHMLSTFGQCLIALAAKKENKNKIHVVNTQGTLKPGSKKHWLNEIHPSKEGFKKITGKIYTQMRAIESSLPK